jgi:hypothetical protein
MTQHAPIPPASRPSATPQPDTPRSNDDYRWTWEKAMAFLTAMAACGKVAEAARTVGMTRQSAYRLRQRSPLVAEGWPLALAAGQERRAARARVRRRKVTLSVTSRETQVDASRQVYTSADRKVTLCAEQIDILPHGTGGFAPDGRTARGFRPAR